MSINRTTFYAYARRAPFGGAISTARFKGTEAILDAWDKARLIDHRWLAYILATAFHETGGTMQPVREAFGKSDAETIARLDKAWAEGKLGKTSEPYWREGWFGRGFVQLTHEANYARMGEILGVDLVGNPALALDMGIAARVLIQGMVRGSFRASRDGRRETLDRYFGNLVGDPVGARAIVNGGGDKAKLIATYYKAFHDALTAASELLEQPADVDPADAVPDDKPIVKSGSAGTIAITTGAAAGTSLIAAIQNPWALAAFALILIAAGVGLWLALTGRVAILRGKAPA